MSFFLNFAFLNIGVGVISAIGDTSEGTMPRLVSAACALAGAWVNICLTAQRLHDMDRSGWVQALPFGLGLAGIALMVLDQPLTSAFGVAMLLAGWVGFGLWLMLAPGSAGPNSFGPSQATGPRRSR